MGPPALNFATGTQSVFDAEAAFNRNMNNTMAYDITWNHGRHNFSFGADYKRLQFNSLAQTDPRGTLTFTGTATSGVIQRWVTPLPIFSLQFLTKAPSLLEMPTNIFDLRRRRLRR